MAIPNGSHMTRVLQPDLERSRPETNERVATQTTATNPFRTSLPALNYQTDTHAESATAPLNDNDILQIQYLIRMPESDAAIQSRSQPDEYGEIVAHGPIEIGVWQPTLDTGVAVEYTRRGSDDSMTKNDVVHIINCTP